MANQVHGANVVPVGRNRGARKGAAESNPKGNIGSHMAGKDQTPAIKVIPQRTTGDLTTKPDKKLVGRAQALLHGFRPESEKLQTIKAQAEAQRGGMSDIVFQIVLLGWNAAPTKADGYLFCKALLSSAETLERSGYQKTQKLADLPSARDAIGASWNTYKSQILRCAEKGIDPTQFPNGTKYREAGSMTGNQARGNRAARTTTAKQAVTDAAGQKDISDLRPELQSALGEFITACGPLDELVQLSIANELHKLTVMAAKAAIVTGATETEEDAATATM